MVRSVICEEIVEGYVNSLLSDEIWGIGLIIGQATKDKDYIVNLVKSPLPDTNPPKSITDVDDQWIAEHGKQVSHMLPGGVHVLGIYIYTTTEKLQSSQNIQNNILSLLYKNSKSPLNCLSEESIEEYYCLQINSDSKKTTCKSLNVTNLNSIWKPTDLSYESFVKHWVNISSSLFVDHQFSVSKSHCIEYSFYKQILLGLSPLCESILESIALINGQLRDNDSNLITDDNSHSKKPNRGSKQKTTTNPTNFTIDLLSTTQSSSENSDDITVTECNEKVSVSGVIEGRACLNSRATVGHAISALKHDLVDSLLNRCRLLCEDLLQSAEENQESTPDPHLVYVCPRRLFTSAAYPPLILCDYMFVDEQISDCVGRFLDLFNIQLTDNMIDSNSEHFPTETDLAKPSSRRYSSSSSSSLTSIANNIHESTHNYQLTLKASLVVLVVVVTLLLMYLLLQPAEEDL